MSGRKGDVKVVMSSSESNMLSIPKAENLPVKVISRREQRRKLFTKGRETGDASESLNPMRIRKDPNRERFTRMQRLLQNEQGGEVTNDREQDTYDCRDAASGSEQGAYDSIWAAVRELQAGRAGRPLKAASKANDPLIRWMRTLKAVSRAEDPLIHPFFADDPLGILTGAIWPDELESMKCEALESEKEGCTMRIEEQEKAGQELVMLDDAACSRMDEQEKTGQELEILDELESLKFEVLESEKEGCMMRMEEQERAGQELVILDDATWTRREEQEKADQEVTVLDGSGWLTFSQFRAEWDNLWSFAYGSFEDTTRIPSMRFTDNHVQHYSIFPMDTLQIYSVKLDVTRGSLHLPLDVFGMVAVRDPIDHNRNVIFQRTRDDCQTLTEEDQYLVLAGPTRAVMAAGSGPVVIEVDLKVKGSTESVDECLGPLVMPIACFTTMYSDLFKCACTSKLSTLEFTLGHIIWSVEATISVQVIHGSWPDGLRGVFAAFTTGTYDGQDFVLRRVIGIGHERIVLLDSRAEKLPITGDGKIKLSRHVVSVETSGKMIFHVNALEGDKQVVEKKTSFDPLEAGRSIGELEFSFCKMEVTVCWSLISQYPEV